MNWFEAFGKRLISATPSFFQKIIYFGASLLAIGLGILALDGNLPNDIQLPLWLVDMADNLIIIGSVAGIIAKATVKHPDAIK